MTLTNALMPEREFLLRTGMVNANVYAGIQQDDCVVWQKVQGGYRNHSLCNHTCVTEIDGKPTGGNYTCKSSFVFAHGAKGFATRETIVGWTKNITAAHAVARDMFFQKHYDAYCQEFHIPPTWGQAIKDELTDPRKKVECNRFGGSPEMHRECTSILSDSMAAGLLVNITTTGRRFITDKQFRQDFAANPPQILAMSFDDVGVDEIKRLAAMDLDEIEAEWRKISPHHGQRQKAYEGLYAAKLMKQMSVPVKILFNVVIHPGNVGHLNELLATLRESVPGCIANPYPAQSFNNEPLPWTPESLPALRKHILHFIIGTLEGMPDINKRISYYNMCESAFREWWPKNPTRLCQFMSGVGAWDPTLRPGGYRYVQIASNAEIIDAPLRELPSPGGHIGDFWNKHVGLTSQVNDRIEEMADTIDMGLVHRGRQLRELNKFAYVQTSSLMPRPALDTVSTELGIPRELVPAYCGTRLEFCGF